MESIKNKDCYVAFLDILGFSNAVMSESPKYIEDIFETIKKCKNAIKQDKCAWPSEYDNLSNNTTVYIMSDSVVMAIKSNINGSLDFLIKWCKEIQIRLLLNHKMLVRGGISQGLHYQDNEVAFGVGFVKAYMIEKSARTPRIIIDDAIDTQNSNYILEDDDKKKYIDFLSGYYMDDKELSSWKAFTAAYIKKAEDLKEKYLWLANQFERSNDQYLNQIEQYEFSKNSEDLQG